MKKLFAIALAVVMALSCMMISAFAAETVLFEGEETFKTDGTYCDPWDGFGIGAPVNEKTVGDLTIEDVRALVVAGGAKIVMEYATTGCWGGASHPEVEFNVWETEELTESIAMTLVTDEATGHIIATVSLDEIYANFLAYGATSADEITNLGIQLWAEGFTLYKLSIVTDGDAPAVEEPVEETPAVEDTPVEETPAVEDTPVETEPADTGLALAVVPMIVAAVAVALSKKR